jgi:hypothetical protein
MEFHVYFLTIFLIVFFGVVEEKKHSSVTMSLGGYVDCSEAFSFILSPWDKNILELEKI